MTGSNSNKESTDLKIYGLQNLVILLEGLREIVKFIETFKYVLLIQVSAGHRDHIIYCWRVNYDFKTYSLNNISPICFHLNRVENNNHQRLILRVEEQVEMPFS